MINMVNLHIRIGKNLHVIFVVLITILFRGAWKTNTI